MFVAINYITCTDAYRERFETLFATRAKAIDRMPGFINMQVLRPTDEKGDYLIVSHWDSEEQFKTWTKSDEFVEGHKRGFADLAEARAKGREAPMKSQFKTYKIISE
ncbi:MAG TPA: antibiotic biosynthesis monooxygenase [Bacteroidales bacterium]|nr:antibiotic biosynthesis monooxygenase [Bacteroidales bacterium]